MPTFDGVVLAERGSTDERAAGDAPAHFIFFASPDGACGIRSYSTELPRSRILFSFVLGHGGELRDLLLQRVVTMTFPIHPSSLPESSAIWGLRSTLGCTHVTFTFPST